VFYLVAQSWEKGLLIMTTDLLFMTVSGVSSILGLLVVRKWRIKGKFGAVHLGLFLAVLLWFLGETTWAFYEIVLQFDVPYPSMADVFYLGAYLPASIGMIQFLWFFRGALTMRKTAAVLFSGSVISGAVWVILLDPIMAESADILTKAFDVGYPLLDAFLIILAIMMSVAYGHGKFAKDWLWIALGMLLQGAGDMAFTYGTLAGWYFSGHPIELFYLLSYLSLGLGFAHQTRSLGVAS